MIFDSSKLNRRRCKSTNFNHAESEELLMKLKEINKVQESLLIINSFYFTGS